MKMKKLRILALLFSIFVIILLLTGCNPGNTGDGTTEAGTTEVPGTDIPATDVTFFKGGSFTFKIVKPAKPVDDEESAARILKSMFSELTGSFPKVITDKDAKEDTSPYLIYVGYADDADVQAFYKELGYGDAGIKVVGNKIMIASYTYDGFSTVISELQTLLGDKITDGVITASTADFVKTETINNVLNSFPVVDDCVRITYTYCDLGQSLMIVSDTSADIFKEYTKKFEADYELVASVEDVGNYFNTYTKGNDMYNVSYSKGDDCIRVIKNADTKPSQYLQQTEVTTVTTPLVNMIGLAYGTEEYAASYQLGLSMVFRLGDGTFMVVDGGFNRDQDAIMVYNFIVENTPSGMKPTISAWFITHAHPDHHNMFAKKFVAKYRNFVDIKALIFNPPGNCINNSSNSSGTKEGLEFQTIINVAKAIPGCEVIRAHVGDRYYIGDAVIDILYTVDYQYPTVFTYYNTCSMIFSVKLGGQRIMVTGDGANVSFNKIAKMYGETLKCDFVQVAHHGYTSGVSDESATAIIEAYKYMAPTVVLYPNGEAGYKNTIGKVYNTYLISLPSVKEVCIAGGVQNIFELPYTPKKAG